MTDIDTMLNNATRKRNPVLKFKETGDKVKGKVTNCQIRDIQPFEKTKPPVKTLIVDLVLAEPRTQVIRKVNDQGLYEDKAFTGTEWTWFVKENSQPLTELSRAVKAANARPGSPHPGDELEIELAGLKPNTKGPNPSQIFKVGLTPVVASPVPSSGEEFTGEEDDELF